MNRFICMIRGYRLTPVREVGVVARPGGLLPSIDGFMSYEPHPDGTGRACTRCHRMVILPGADS